MGDSGEEEASPLRLLPLGVEVKCAEGIKGEELALGRLELEVLIDPDDPSVLLLSFRRDFTEVRAMTILLRLPGGLIL